MPLLLLIRIALCGLALASVAGCGGGGSGDSSSTQSTTSSQVPSLGQIKFLPVSYDDPASDLQTAPAVPPSLIEGTDADLLRKECRATEPPRQRLGVAGLPALVAAAAAALVSFVFNYISTEIGNALQAEVDKYKQSYKVETPGYFYYLNGPVAADGGKIAAANGTLSAAFRCFRYSRMVDGKKFSDGDDPKNLAVDIVGEIRIDPSGQFVQVRPLRTYYAQSKVPGGDAVTLGFELSATGLWRDGLSGKTGAIFDTVVMTEKFPYLDVKPNSAPKYYFNSDSYNWDKQPRLPLPTPSYDRSGNIISVASTLPPPPPVGRPTLQLAGNVVLTATVSEVGTPPWWVSSLQSFWKSQGDTLSKAAASAVQTQLGLTSSSSSSSGGGGSSQ